jgi:hypothetical protein
MPSDTRIQHQIRRHQIEQSPDHHDAPDPLRTASRAANSTDHGSGRKRNACSYGSRAAGARSPDLAALRTRRGDRRRPLAVEGLIRNLLHDRNPAISFLDEEHTASQATGTPIGPGPIDGTINVAHGDPAARLRLTRSTTAGTAGLSVLLTTLRIRQHVTYMNDHALTRWRETRGSTMSYGEPTAATKYALFWLCRGLCYKPGCSRPVVKLVDDRAQTMAKVAHIYGRRRGSARWDPGKREEYLKSFRNLLLLCATHHDEVDGPLTRHLFSVELLEQWKREREKLDSLPAGAFDDVDDTTLLSQMVTAVDSTRSEIREALTQLPREIADILRSMVDDGFTRPYLDIEAIYALDSAAQRLLHLPDSASQLYSTVNRLEEAIGPLRQLTNNMAEATSQAATTVTDWHTATRDAPDGSAWTSTVNMAINRLQSEIDALLDYEPPPLQLDRENFWWAIRKGAVWGALIAAIVTAVATAWITLQIMR